MLRSKIVQRYLGRSVSDATERARTDHRSLYSIEAEQGFLGAALIDNSLFAQTAGDISPEDHFVVLHKQAHKAALAMLARGERVNPMTLATHFLDRELVDGKQTALQYLVSITRDAPTTRNAPSYARAVREFAVRRTEVLIGEDIIAAAKSSAPDFPAAERLSEHLRRLSSLREVVAENARVELKFAQEASRDTLSLYVVKGAIPAGSIGIVYGGPGSGKTFWLIDCGFAVGLGNTFMGRRTRAGAVLYVAL